MKTLFAPVLCLLTVSQFITSCDIADTGLTEQEVRAGLKEALRVGTDTATAKGHATDGFFGNLAIKIFLPEEASTVQSVVSALPGGQLLLDELVKKLNRAAEDAAVKAQPIFIDAIGNITINDAFSILNGSNDAATIYLETNTREGLYDAFQPDIESSLSSVGAQQAWNEVITLYNQVPLVPPVNADLSDHTTNKGLDGLFYLVAEEEGKIRNDATHRVTEILREVFSQ